MGYPSENFEAVYRNSILDVANSLDFASKFGKC
jgi:hypothetical protein